MPSLHYDVYNNRHNSVTRGVSDDTKDLQWASNTATLIYGEREGV